MTSYWLESLCRAGGWLLVSGCVVWLCLRWFPLANPRNQQLVWGAVLLQGLLLFPVPVEIPLPAAWQASLPSWPALAKESSGTSRDSAPGVEPIEAARASVVPEASSGSPGSVVTTRDVEGGAVQMGAQSMDHRSAVIGHERESASEQFVTVHPTASVPDSERLTAGAAVSLPADETVALVPVVQDSAERGVIPLETDRTGEAVSPRIEPEEPSVAGWWRGNLRSWLMGGWAVGSLAFLTLTILQYVALLYALRRSYRARREWQEEFVALCVELGVGTPVQLRVHPTLGPLLCWTPAGYRVVVPRKLWERLPLAERRAVLHHELCHLRRGDLWWGSAVRSVIVLHWFNPLAWFSARRFAAACEAACDSLLTSEAPRRGADLARALLTAVELRQPASHLAAAATGGDLYRRVRQLITGASGGGDNMVRKGTWCVLILGMGLLANVGWRFEQEVIQAVYGDDAPAASGGSPAETSPSPVPTDVAKGVSEIAARLVIDQPVVKHFAQALRTPAGQVVLADRGALAAQEVANEQDAATLWEQFVARHFQQQGNSWMMVEQHRKILDEYTKSVTTAESEIAEIAELFAKTAAQLGKPADDSLALLQRFLRHPGAPAYIYFHEVRSRLHPTLNDLTEQLGDQLVRRQSGEYVIRPARRAQVAKRLEFVRQLAPALERFSRELADWSKDLSAVQPEHQSLVKTLQNPLYPRYVLFDYLSEEDRPNDEAFESMFYFLEEATQESAQGLKFNTESDEFRQLQEEIERFETVTSQLTALTEPLQELAQRIRAEDELHTGLKTLLTSDLGVMWLARDMNYLPISAGDAAEEWLNYYITRNEAGQIELAMEDPEELRNALEEFFRSTREIRRRGRVIDDFARQLPSGALQQAMLSHYGKLQLFELIEQTAERPEVDGVAYWIEQHFDETAEGLVLKDWAGDVLSGFLQEVEEIEAELGKADF